MPWTASSPLHPRATAKARPSAATRAANLIANTPVLFRLPAIPSTPIQPAATPVVAAEVGAAVAEKMEVAAPLQATASLPQLAATVETKQIETSASIAEASRAETKRAESSRAELERTQHSQVPLTSAEHNRSWWEHWSSGIALIILLIALATASVLVLRGGGHGEPKFIADVDQSQSVSSNALESLSNIEVPQLGATQSPDKLSLEAESIANVGNARQLEQTTANDTTTSLIPSDSLTLTPRDSVPATSGRRFLGVDISKFPVSETSDSAAEEITTGEVNSLVLSPPPSPSTTTSNPSTQLSQFSEELVSPHATASLNAPVGVQQPRLFDDVSPASRPSNISATPASSAQPSSTSGSSPSFYDSSNNSLSSPSLNQQRTTELTSSSNPSVPAVPVSAANPGVASATSGLSLIVSEQDLAANQATSNSQPIATPQSNTSSPTTSTLRTTTTPEFNREQLLKAYQDFTRTPVQGQNRYQTSTSPAQPPSAQPPSAQPINNQTPTNLNPAAPAVGGFGGQVAGGTAQPMTLPYLNPQLLNGTNPQQYPPYNAPQFSAQQNGMQQNGMQPNVMQPPMTYDPSLYTAPMPTSGQNTASGYGTPNPTTYR